MRATPGLAILAAAAVAARCEEEVRRIETEDAEDASTIVSSSETIASPFVPVRG